MISKYKSVNRGYGKGWWYESERHRLSRLGIKTGTKTPPSVILPPHLTSPSLSYQKVDKIEVGIERAKKKHPIMVGMTKGVLLGTFFQAPFGTVLGIPAGAYVAKKRLEYERKEREYYRKHKGVKFGKGWWREPERHRISALGIKSGSRITKDRGYPPYVSPLQHMYLSAGLTPGSKMIERRGSQDKVIEYLKKHGWRYREEPASMTPGTIEAWKGKNYLLLAPTHWKKFTIEKIYIRDKDVGDRLKQVFRKPYPYRIGEVTKKDVVKKKKFIFFAKSLAVFKDPKARYNISYLGKELEYRHTYNEEKFPDWSSDAQSTIDSQKRRGKSVALIHRGKYHDLYSEPISYSKFDVKRVPESLKNRLISLVKLRNIPSISYKSNIANRLGAKKGELLVIEGVGVDLEYGLSRDMKRSLSKKLIKVI